jgi:hypothetical protein
VYFPHTLSSIYLPVSQEDDDPRIIRALEDSVVWGILSSGLDEGRHISKEKASVVATMRGIDPERLREAAQRKLDGISASEPHSEAEFRRHEYEAFLAGAGGEHTDLLVQRMDMTAYSTRLAGHLSQVCLVRKLRETRALVGFTRVLPPGGSVDDPRVQKLSLQYEQLDWLPATTVRGEGIFMELDSSRLTSWLSDHRYGARIERMARAYNEVRTSRGQPHRPIGPVFVALHTLAHVLMKQLSIDCGYGSAALRERLYCDETIDGESMNGLLIYTASGDSEGSMGGLVRQGMPLRLEATLRRALLESAWCAADPVCIESGGQGSDNTNLAACHGCALLPETSCEEGNRLLDRAALIGVPEDPTLGFFREYLEF